MDSRRAQTLEALAAYISQQKAIFERTQSTIDELRRLKGEAVAPAADVGGLAEQLSGSAFRLSEQAAECAPQVPESIDWTLFAEKDPKPLQALALSARTAYEARNKPGVTSRAPLSDLQKFVREAKQTILDPVLALYADPPDEDEEMLDAPASPSRKYTKNDKTDVCAASTTSRMPPRGPSGLFTRRKATSIDTTATAMAMDLDASASVSGSTTAVDSSESTSTHTTTSSPLPLPFPLTPLPLPMSLCRPPSPSPKSKPGQPPVPLALAKPVRARRISTKLAHQNHDRSEALVTRARRKSSGAVSQAAAPTTPAAAVGKAAQAGTGVMLRIPAMATRARRESMRRRASSVADPPPPPSDPAPESERSPSPPSPTSPAAAPDPDPDADPVPDADAPPTPPTVLGKRTRRPSASANAKGKPDTYKVMWSAEEQNLLERLLEEIPADDPRRYLKISVAMEGRRTPRQVSSRVQKYLQKLKKYGVEGR